MLKLIKYLKRRDWCFFLISIGFIVGNVWLELEIPEYMQKITTFLQTTGDHMSDILKNGGIMILFAIGSMICAVIANLFSSLIAADLGKNLRGTIYEKVISFSNAEIRGFSTASLITRSTNDVTQVQSLIAMGLAILIKAPTMAIMALVKIVKAHYLWTVATVSMVALIVVSIVIIMSVSIPRFKRIQLLTDELNKVTRENLTGTRVIRAFNAEKYQEAKFEKVNNNMTNVHLFTSKFMSMMDPMMTFVMSSLPLSIYTIGAFLIDKAQVFEKLSIFTQMITFSTYAIQVLMSFVLLVFIFIMLPRAEVSAKRINEIIDKKPSIIDGDGNNKPIKKGEVQFVNVGFKYPDAEEYVLHDISFKAEKGQTIAFIGSTGSGKSTLINLVPRLYDATEGQVIVDGVDVKDYKQEDLNSIVGYIPQKAFLFSGTVESNITMGTTNNQKPSNDDILNAIEISQSKFVYDLVGGIDARIDQGGKNVSGGQKQRLSIARALARKPEILIFDDSFSALDYKTDKLLRQAIKEKSADTTCLIVAQRIGTIKNADKIIVLDSGKIVGEGKHDELMENCEIYREIALSQLSKEELQDA